jgi:antitoxin component of RelBE/YafQ-DinJ toxin-antitoxin module
MKNIWNKFNFKKIDNEIAEKKEAIQLKEEVLKTNFKKFIDIIESRISTEIGNIPGFVININEKGINLFINRTPVAVFRIKNDSFIVTDKINNVQLFINDDLVFKKFVNKVIRKNVIPFVVNQCKSKVITNIPEKLKEQIKTYTFENITEEKFKEFFEKISEKDGNSESIIAQIITKTPELCTIEFTIHAGRYGIYDENILTVNNFGDVKLKICELLEGGDIDGQVKRNFISYFFSTTDAVTPGIVYICKK